MSQRKHKRIRQEWAGRPRFVKHQDGHCWMVVGWRFFKEFKKWK